VTFSDKKVVVPCGQGDLTVRELKELAITRYKKAVGKPAALVFVYRLEASEGGILDPDDRLTDVCDDKEELIAVYDEDMGYGDGMEDTIGCHGSCDNIEISDIRSISDHGVKKEIKIEDVDDLGQYDVNWEENSIETDIWISDMKLDNDTEATVSEIIPSFNVDHAVVGTSTEATTERPSRSKTEISETSQQPINKVVLDKTKEKLVKVIKSTLNRRSTRKVTINPNFKSHRSSEYKKKQIVKKQRENSKLAEKKRRCGTCGACRACTKADCGLCKNCLNKIKFGGSGTWKKPCLERRSPCSWEN